MNTLPFSDIVTAGISSVASLIDKIPAEPDNSAREFIEILKGIVSGDNSLSKYAMANIVGKTVISKEIAYSDNGLRMILDKTDNAGYETQKVEGINAIQMLWQLIDSKGNLVIDGSSEAQRGIGGNLSFIIKNSDGALSKEDGEVFKKAVTELITTILTVFFKSEDPSGENNNITTIDNIDPQNRSALKPEKDIPEKDVDGNNTKPHVTIQPPVKTSNPVNNI
ncbi:MAG: hypothetical protein KBI10_07720, partial [Syntrophorhabdales bacterium]|nr:hypothetical protein [Syntrophorhabdales bacterium]